MFLKILFALLGIILGGLLGFFGVFYLCKLIDFFNSPKPGNGAVNAGWIFTFITVPLFAIIGCVCGIRLAAFFL